MDNHKTQWNTENYSENDENMLLYDPNSKCYLFCLKKKYEIATLNEDNLFKKKTEIMLADT